MKDKAIGMVIVLTVTAALAALILAFVNNLTKAKIDEAYRQDFLKGLSVVLPGFDNEPDRETVKVDGQTLYIGKKGGKIFGYAMQSSSQKGYGGEIVVLVGADTNGKILGIQIIKHSETPGLGNRIETQQWRDEFTGMTKDSKIGVKKDGGSIDSFSGATISPRAVCEAVKSAIATLSKAGGHK